MSLRLFLQFSLVFKIETRNYLFGKQHNKRHFNHNIMEFQLFIWQWLKVMKRICILFSVASFPEYRQKIIRANNKAFISIVLKLWHLIRPLVLKNSTNKKIYIELMFLSIFPSFSHLPPILIRNLSFSNELCIEFHQMETFPGLFDQKGISFSIKFSDNLYLSFCNICKNFFGGKCDIKNSNRGI